MKWEKRGLIYNTKANREWNQSHAQVPTVLKVNQEIIRIYFCSRDTNNRSYTTFIDVDANNLQNILYEHDKPILELGEIGTFDDSGIMPTWIEKFNKVVYLYYIGWNVGNTSRYRVAHGLAISEDNGITFKRYSKGPMMDRNYIDPISVSNHSIIREDDKWKMWYMSYCKWEIINGISEPFYNIKYAESKDGINWDRKGVICIDFKDEVEAGIARPSVIKENGIYKMWYSYRTAINYRKDKKGSYRIGYAESSDGINWIRMDDKAGINLSKKNWDSEMIEYPFILKIKGKLVMFYNGNGFGKSGFGYAVLHDD